MYQHHHVSRYLDQILMSILHESPYRIQYLKNSQETSYEVHFSKSQPGLVNGSPLESTDCMDTTWIVLQK